VFNPLLHTQPKDDVMNKDTLEGNWKQAKGKLREKWGELTDDDVDKVDGKFDNLVGKLQERYGKAKEDVEREVKSFLAKFDD